MDRLSERQKWREEALRQVKYSTNFLSDESQILRSRRVVQKRELTQLQGQRQRQPILKYICVLLILTAIIPTRLIFSTVRESIRDCVFTTPIKRRAYLDVSRRNRAGTTKKNCDTQLDSTKRRNAEQENGNKTENWQRIYR